MDNKFIEYDRLQMIDYSENSNNVFVHNFILKEDFKMHWHNFYELEYVLSGSGCNLMNGIKYNLQSGSLFIVDPTDFHELLVYEPMNIIKATFNDYSVNPAIFNLLISFLYNLNLTLDDEEKEIFDDFFLLLIKEKSLKNNQNYNFIVRNLFECLLAHIIDISKKRNLKQFERFSNNDNMQKALVYIHKNFRNHIDLRTLADHVHLSSSYLSRIFHKSFGVTFKKYLSDIRLDFSQKLLVNSQLNITEICYESGFGSLPNFMREFKQKFLTSPLKYREENKKETENV